MVTLSARDFMFNVIMSNRNSHYSIMPEDCTTRRGGTVNLTGDIQAQRFAMGYRQIESWIYSLPEFHIIVETR